MQKEISEYVVVERNTNIIYALIDGSTRIGRNKIGNDIVIKHRSCSNYHAAIKIRSNLILFHDFSDNGTSILKRTRFEKIKNETTRIYEDSKFRIADKEFKLCKLKNVKTDIIEINDSDDESIQEDNNNQANKSETTQSKPEILKKVFSVGTITERLKHFVANNNIDMSDSDMEFSEEEYNPLTPESQAKIMTMEDDEDIFELNNSE